MPRKCPESVMFPRLARLTFLPCILPGDAAGTAPGEEAAAPCGHDGKGGWNHGQEKIRRVRARNNSITTLGPMDGRNRARNEVEAASRGGARKGEEQERLPAGWFAPPGLESGTVLLPPRRR